jgi:hypothetical protein
LTCIAARQDGHLSVAATSGFFYRLIVFFWKFSAATLSRFFVTND